MIVIERIAALIHITKGYGFTNPDNTTVRCFHTCQHFKKRGLTRTIGTDNTDNPTGRQLKAQIIDKQLVTECLRQMVCLDNNTAQPLGNGNNNLCLANLFTTGFSDKIIIGTDTRLGL